MKTKFFLLLLLSLLSLQCKNPFKDDEPEKERVLILVNNEYFTDTGRYVLFWNGKNEDSSFVSAGKYIILMEAKNFNDQISVTAQEGGKNGSNNKAHVELGYYSRYELESVDPNPFKVQSGVNISIIIPQVGRVKITIYKD